MDPMSRFVIARWAVAGSLTVLAATAAAQEVVELPAEDRPLSVEMENVFGLGSLDAPEWQHFGKIQSSAFDGEGNLFLLDIDARNILVVDGEGALAGRIGRPGGGPGEFDFPRYLAVLPDGRIVVADIPRHRFFQIFHGDGAFDRGVRVGNDLLGIHGAFHADRGGSDAIILSSANMARYLPMQPEESKDPPGTRSILRLKLEDDDLAQEAFAYAWAPPTPEPIEFRIGNRTIGTGETTPPPRIFDPGLFLGTLPGGGIAFSDSSAYSVKVTDASGGIARILSRPFAPEPVTDRIVEEEIERRLDEFALTAVATFRRASRVVDGAGNPIEGLIPDEMIVEGGLRSQRASLEARAAAEEVPVVLDLRTTWEGEIWVRRRGDRPSSDGPIDVLTPDGRYLGSLPADTPMPDAFGPGGLVAFVETGELGQYTVRVSRMRLTGSPGDADPAGIRSDESRPRHDR